MGRRTATSRLARVWLAIELNQGVGSGINRVKGISILNEDLRVVRTLGHSGLCPSL
jgi:hypothetical protein